MSPSEFDFERPAMPRAQIIYGEIIYWMAILAAIVCTIGPFIAMAAPENNVLKPHHLFTAIFDGKCSEEVWSIGAVGQDVHDEWKHMLETAYAGDRDEDLTLHPFLTRTRLRSFEEGCLTIEVATDELIERFEKDDVLAQMTAAAPDLGVTKVEIHKGLTRGGHMWLEHFTKGDGFCQFGLALGCGCALWGLLAVACAYLFEKPRPILYVVLALWVSGLVLLSATGAVSG